LRVRESLFHRTIAWPFTDRTQSFLPAGGLRMLSALNSREAVPNETWISAALRRSHPGERNASTPLPGHAKKRTLWGDRPKKRKALLPAVGVFS